MERGWRERGERVERGYGEGWCTKNLKFLRCFCGQRTNEGWEMKGVLRTVKDMFGSSRPAMGDPKSSLMGEGRFGISR